MTGPESKELLVRRGVMTSLVANILNDLLAHDLFKTISVRRVTNLTYQLCLYNVLTNHF